VVSIQIPGDLRRGVIAGVLSTVATDVSMLILYAATGTPLDYILRLIGSAALVPFNSPDIPVLPVALVADYGIGILSGIVFILAVSRISRLRSHNWLRAVIIGIVFGEALGSALYWGMASLLHLPASQALSLFGTASFFHLVWGVTLGLSARLLPRSGIDG
jgi:hypothetical protein